MVRRRVYNYSSWTGNWLALCLNIKAICKLTAISWRRGYQIVPKFFFGKPSDKVAEQSPPAVSACKKLIQQGRSGTISTALPLERELFVGLFDTQDQVEGVSAFLQKRKANWVNG